MPYCVVYSVYTSVGLFEDMTPLQFLLGKDIAKSITFQDLLQLVGRDELVIANKHSKRTT